MLYTYNKNIENNYILEKIKFSDCILKQLNVISTQMIEISEVKSDNEIKIILQNLQNLNNKNKSNNDKEIYNKDKDNKSTIKNEYTISYSLPIYHYTKCPAENFLDRDTKFTEIIEKINKESKFGLASVGIIMDNQGNILITRRADHMRTFPGAWVFPGGKVDPGEVYYDGLKREILEEVGIDFDLYNTSNANDSTKENIFSEFVEEKKDNKTNLVIEPLLCYESGYAESSETGLPTRRVLIIYFIIKINEHKDNIKLKMQLEEIGGYTWININKLNNIFTKFEGEFEAYIRNLKDLSYNKTMLKERDLEEGVPYGHRIAFDQLMVNLKVQNSDK